MLDFLEGHIKGSCRILYNLTQWSLCKWVFCKNMPPTGRIPLLHCKFMHACPQYRFLSSSELLLQLTYISGQSFCGYLCMFKTFLCNLMSQRAINYTCRMWWESGKHCRRWFVFPKILNGGKSNIVDFMGSMMLFV